MPKKKLTRIILLSAGGVLALVCLYIALTAYRGGEKIAPVDEGGTVAEVAFAPAEIDVVAIDAAPTPAPTAQPGLPQSAVDILVNDRAILAVSDESAAKALLTKLLNVSAVAPEGERFLSAAYECDIRFIPSDGLTPYYDFDTAFNLLFSEPSLIPVTVETERTNAAIGEAAVTTEKNAALYKGARNILQLGAGARQLTRTKRIYVGDEVIAESEPQSETVMEARATIIETGAFKKDNDKKDAGAEGKDAGSLKLRYPMRGTLSSYFGVRDGNMHAGIDIAAKAGTNVTAPAEGVVVYCAERGGYGFTVDIDHGGGFVSRLTHLTDVSCELNERVFAGNGIGKLANEAAEGEKPSLHYELLIDGVPYNPLFYLS